mgnify:CR=1 FL=1
MHVVVKERNVQEASEPVEIKALPNRDDQKKGDEPDRVCRPGQHRCIAVGQGPKHQHLIGRPDRDAAGDGPEYVVPDLATERELPPVLHQRAGVVFQRLPLFGEGVEVKMQAAGDECHQDDVAYEHFGDPAKGQDLGLFQGRLKKVE